MGYLSLWGAGHFGRVLFGQTSTPLTTYYLALINGDEPSGFISGSELAEITTSGTGYARKAIANTSANWTEKDYGRMVNTNTLTFTTATASWGRVRSWAVCDAATGGNVVFYGNFAQSKFVDTGDTFIVNAGSLRFRARMGSR